MLQEKKKKKKKKKKKRHIQGKVLVFNMLLPLNIVNMPNFTYISSIKNQALLCPNASVLYTHIQKYSTTVIAPPTRL